MDGKVRCSHRLQRSSWKGWLPFFDDVWCVVVDAIPVFKASQGFNITSQIIYTKNNKMILI